MVVRVVDPGPMPEVVKNAVCRHCGAKLEYVPNDVKEYHGKDYTGGADGRKWIDCPQCSKEVTLESW